MKTVEAQLNVEINELRINIDAQKHVIKQSLGKEKLVEVAGQELKALTTRLGVLEGNLATIQAKETSSPL